uniref:Uncharacterized protein n=1 Tax=Heterorhabditis bacteriophora TaxID=37862 RepID=A0A1I7WC47_HETBA
MLIMNMLSRFFTFIGTLPANLANSMVCAVTDEII